MQGGPEERGLIRGRERKEFSLSFLPSPPRDKASSHHEMYFLEHSLSPRGKGHTMRKKKIPMSSVAGKEESNSYRSLPESSNFLLENNVSSILANVAYITCIYMRERIASRVWKSWENGPRSRNKCLRRTWLHVHVYRRNGREHC